MLARCGHEPPRDSCYEDGCFGCSEAKILTKDLEEYLKSPNHCPYCGSVKIDSDRMEVDDNDRVNAIVECDDCGRKWRDIYKVVEVEELPNA